MRPVPLGRMTYCRSGWIKANFELNAVSKLEDRFVIGQAVAGRFHRPRIMLAEVTVNKSEDRLIVVAIRNQKVAQLDEIDVVITDKEFPGRPGPRSSGLV